MSAALTSAGLAVSAALCWGSSDFVGGYTARRANAFVLTTIAHASGTVFMIVLALVNRSPLPPVNKLAWAIAAGFSGGAALAVFYRALSSGKMGLAAPVSAVVAATIPTLFGMVTEGLPGPFKITGFVFAALGIYLVSRPDEAGHPKEVTSAALAAIGFAGYFLFIKQAGEGSSVFWIAGLSRFASFILTLMIVLAGRGRPASIRPASVDSVGMDAHTVALGILAGFMDISGSALFIRASQIGRLDVAVVLSSLYPAVTVLLAGLLLHERFTRWKLAGMMAALAAVPLIAA
jgi:drug/metabolite transporter (DMT)-like permease